jgi:hypothetical protein
MSQLIVGGAGTYAALGARLVAGGEHSRSVGWIVDMGSDFPADFRQMIDSWNTSCVFREDKSRVTTRAWNGYGSDDSRGWCLYHVLVLEGVISRHHRAESEILTISIQIPDTKDAA